MSFNSHTSLHQNLSFLLAENERLRVVELLGKKTHVLSSGMVERLSRKGSEWEERSSGLICYAKDNDTKTRTIMYVDPSIGNTRIVEYFNWHSISQLSIDDKKEFISFQSNAETVGLRFYSEVEATHFHGMLIISEAEQKAEVRRVVSENMHAPMQPIPIEVSSTSHQSSSWYDKDEPNETNDSKKKEKPKRVFGQFFVAMKEQREEKKKHKEDKKREHYEGDMGHDNISIASFSSAGSQDSGAANLGASNPFLPASDASQAYPAIYPESSHFYIPPAKVPLRPVFNNPPPPLPPTLPPPLPTHRSTSSSSEKSDKNQIAEDSTEITTSAVKLRNVPQSTSFSSMPATSSNQALRPPPAFHPPPPPPDTMSIVQALGGPSKATAEIPEKKPDEPRKSPSEPPSSNRFILPPQALRPAATNNTLQPAKPPPPLPAPRPSIEIVQKVSRPCCKESNERAAKAERERDELAARFAELEKRYRKALNLLASTKLNGGTDQYETALREFVLNACQIGVQGLLREFAEIRQRTQPIGATPKIAFDTNPDKNRYLDVYCVDESRVVLSGAGPDYIHANWVDVEEGQRRYICTQGPMEATVDDFWRMVWQEKCRSIVMLCNVMECGSKKCEQYWPLEVGTEVAYGALRVSSTAKEEFEGLMTITKLTISDGSNPFVRNSHEIEHILWHDWPDRGVPSDALACLKLIDKIKELSPTVIHCSAGIGRTGTIVALDLILSSLRTGDSRAAKEIVIDLRAKRHGSVQMDIQYLFMHRVLIALGLSMEVVEESEVLEFISAYEELCKQRGFI